MSKRMDDLHKDIDESAETPGDKDSVRFNRIVLAAVVAPLIALYFYQVLGR